MSRPKVDREALRYALRAFYVEAHCAGQQWVEAPRNAGIDTDEAYSRFDKDFSRFLTGWSNWPAMAKLLAVFGLTRDDLRGEP
jgi:hypothetical protein